jgi:hypothetical protein
MALGFIPTVLIYQIVKQYSKSNHLNMIIATCVTTFWFSFEIYNVVQPLFIKNTQANNFKPDLSNVIFDTLTDICFFAIGAFLAGLTIRLNQSLIVVNVILFLTVIYPSYYWYTTKMYQQEAKFPFQLRLSQWKTNLDENSKSTINNFVNNTNKGHHLLVFGNYKSGKTSLSAAIAN